MVTDDSERCPQSRQEIRHRTQGKSLRLGFNSSSPEDSSDREDLRNVGTNLLCFSHQRLLSLESDGSKPMALNISIGIGEIETELTTDSDLSFDAIESLLNRAVVSVLQLYMALPEKDRMSVVGLEMEDDEDEDVE